MSELEMHFQLKMMNKYTELHPPVPYLPDTYTKDIEPNRISVRSPLSHTHPYIIQLTDTIESTSFQYLVMEEGKRSLSLHVMMTDYGLPEVEARRFFRQVRFLSLCIYPNLSLYLSHSLTLCRSAF